MKQLLVPAVQIMNRLKYAYKFGMIGLLIVLQAAVLIYMLVSELNKNIDFAIRERGGVEYVTKLTNLFNEAQAYRNIQYDFSHGNKVSPEDVLAQQAKVDEALIAVEAVDKQTAHQMDTTWKLQIVQQDWLTRKAETLQSDIGRAQLVFDLDNRWISEITDLMQHVGYESNLAMDSDFDTSYLIDSVLRKLPKTAENISTAQGLSIQLYEDNVLPTSRNQILQVAGLMRSSLEQVAGNANQVFRHNQKIKSKLEKLQTTVTEFVPIFAWNIEQKTVGQQGLPVPQQLLTTMGNNSIESIEALHKAELVIIDQELVLRIEQYLQYRNLVIVFTVGILLLVSYLFLGFDMSVRKAVYQLSKLMTKVGNGDLNVRGELYSQDEMGYLTHSINNTLNSLQKMYEEVQESHIKLEEWNQKLEQKIAARTASLRNLLDHAGQGFLSFGEDLLVSGQYSAECTTIFAREIAGESVPALIYPNDRDQQVFLEAIFKKILAEKNDSLQNPYFSLLPEEIVIGNSYIGMAYKLIDNKQDSKESSIMMILTDLTLQKTMEDNVQKEHDILAMIVYVVTHSTDFFAAVSQYTEFCQEGMPSLLNEKKAANDILAAIFRMVHTFKGTFGQLHMGNIMGKLHDMESLLAKIRSKELMQLDSKELKEKLNDFTSYVMINWLDADLNLLKEKLGDEFFQQENMLIVDNQRLLEIEEKVKKILPYDERNVLLPDLHRLRYQSIKKLLQSYPEYVTSLAERNEKAIHSFAIEGSDILVDPLRYNDFIKSLGHVFRNSITHGLEPFEERAEKGKDEIGKITCAVKENSLGMTIVISDDGTGMNPDHIREAAVKKGICSAEDAHRMDDTASIMLIFADGFSESKDITELAGRGVGLSAVRAEVEKLNGSVQVNTLWGKGTQFEFFLPFTQIEEHQSYSIRQLGNPLVRATEALFKQNAGLQLNNCTYIESANGGKLKLRQVTTFLGINGMGNCRMVLSADQSVVTYLADEYLLEEASEGTFGQRLEAVLSYYAKQIFTDALKEVPEWGGLVTTKALVSIVAEDASAKYPQSETPTWLLDTDLGKITLSLVF